jgi:hypothetical protein
MVPCIVTKQTAWVKLEKGFFSKQKRELGKTDGQPKIFAMQCVHMQPRHQFLRLHAFYIEVHASPPVEDLCCQQFSAMRH